MWCVAKRYFWRQMRANKWITVLRDTIRLADINYNEITSIVMSTTEKVYQIQINAKNSQNCPSYIVTSLHHLHGILLRRLR